MPMGYQILPIYSKETITLKRNKKTIGTLRFCGCYTTLGSGLFKNIHYMLPLVHHSPIHSNYRSVQYIDKLEIMY